ncbi:MAG: hypothetical protein AAF805_04795 [Planctomycetota bacterium]
MSLPLDLLAEARSPRSLAASVSVAPLPPLDRPLLAAVPVPQASVNDPFAGDAPSGVSFKRDPMGALGALLGATAEDLGEDAVAADSVDFAAQEDPADDPFAQGSTAAAEVEPDDGDAGDDFAFDGDDDPFADF